MKPEKPQALAPAVFVSMLSKGGWQITGGQEAKHLGPPMNVSSADISSKAMTIGLDGDGYGFYLGLDTFTVTKVHPYLIQVNKLYMTSVARSKAEGGGTHEIQRPGVAFTFRNKTLEEAHAAALEQKEADRKWREAALHRQRVERLGVLGKSIIDVEFETGKHGFAYLKFADGTELQISGTHIEFSPGITKERESED